MAELIDDATMKEKWINNKEMKTNFSISTIEHTIALNQILFLLRL